MIRKQAQGGQRTFLASGGRWCGLDVEVVSEEAGCRVHHGRLRSCIRGKQERTQGKAQARLAHQPQRVGPQALEKDSC